MTVRAPDWRVLGYRGGRGFAAVGLLAVILVLAAWLRLPGLDARGQWDADQGRDMLVLTSMTHGGGLPLLGPATSIGGFHHGVVYDYLLAPVAALSGDDPVAVTGAIAVAGIAAVAAIAWLGWLVGGPVAGVAAGLFAAVSPSLIGSSIFLWEPNLIPLAAAVGLAGVLRARRTGRARWWLVAGVGIGLAMQFHVLDAVLVLPVLWAWADDARRRRQSGRPVGGTVRGGIGALALIALGYAPLAVHELTNGFSELAALVAFFGGSGGAAVGRAAGPAERLVMVVVRVLSWPVAGLVTDRVLAAMLGLAVVVVLAVAAWLPARLPARPGPRVAASTGVAAPADATAAGGVAAPGAAERWAVGWLLGTLVFSIAALAVLAPSLAVVVPQLPNDHYHAFLDPVVLALAGAGVARIVRTTRSTAEGEVGLANGRGDAAGTANGRWNAAGPALGLSLTAGLVAVSVGGWPPTVSPDGGWRLADAAAAHIVDVEHAGWPAEEPKVLVSLPPFKSDDAMRFPLLRRGLGLKPALLEPVTIGSVPVGVLTIVCDPVFDGVVGAPCGGPSEDRWLAVAYAPGTMRLVERFRAGDRRILSIYAPSRLVATPGWRPGAIAGWRP